MVQTTISRVNQYVKERFFRLLPLTGFKTLLEV